MNARTPLMNRHAALLVLLLPATGALGAGCARVEEPAALGEEAVGSAEEAVTLPPPGDPRHDPTCTGAGYSAIHNAGWPSHAPGPCPGVDAYSFDDAVAACDANVSYFGYTCSTHVDTNTHTWTAYLGCCAGTCGDGIQNQGEGGVDCGGPCAAACPTCQDGIRNQGETSVDCGGPCSPCAEGQGCTTGSDCASGVCSAGVCGAPDLCAGAHSPAPTANAALVSNPAPVVTTPPGEIVLRKNLSGYNSYGADGRADIVYSGQTAAWTFALPPGSPPVTSAYFVISLVADDHNNIPTQSYSYALWASNVSVFDGPAQLPHGGPFGSIFNNWTSRTYPACNAGNTFTITFQNDSALSSGHWLAVDWIELHAVTQ